MIDSLFFGIIDRSMNTRFKKIRDPVHKDIYLSREELEVLDTPEMQRLRGIRQLGAAFYVYPGANHSRFEHCLGTCWMAKKLVSALEQYAGRLLPEDEKKAVFLAALIHDVTHIPFGHTFEDERKLLPRHDMDMDRYQHFLFSGKLGSLLDGTECGRLARSLLRPDKKSMPEKNCLRQIVDGMICADLLDYLKRDNYYCGLSQFYDDRLFHYFDIHAGRLMLSMHRDGLFRNDALSEITHLLRIRYVLSERVYYHHAKIASGVMISKAIEKARQSGMQVQELYRLQDDVLPFYLTGNYGQDAQLRELVDWFTARELFKRCYMLSRNIGHENVKALEHSYHSNREDHRHWLESQIARKAGAAPHEIAVYCPSARMALKEAQMPVICAPDVVRRFCDLNSAEIKVLQQQHRALWKFYVFVSPRIAGKIERVGEICEELVGFRNELPALRP